MLQPFIIILRVVSLSARGQFKRLFWNLRTLNGVVLKLVAVYNAIYLYTFSGLVHKRVKASEKSLSKYAVAAEQYSHLMLFSILVSGLAWERCPSN